MAPQAFNFARPASSVERFRSLSDNERQILGFIRRDAPVSRSELARRTRLALPTVSRITDRLLQEGLIAGEEKVMMTAMGQPSLPLSIAPQAAYAFGVAVRADTLTVSLAHLSGSVVASTSEPHAGMTREETVERIALAIAGLMERSRVAPDRVCGLGLGLPGFFVSDPKRINAPLGMEDWATGDLERDLGGALGLPLLVENDGTAAALGEYQYGRGDRSSSLAFLYIDRGLGGGVVEDGRLLRGRRGNAGEFTGLLHPDARSDRPTLQVLHAIANEAGETYTSLDDMVRGIDPRSEIVDRWIERTVPATNAIISAIGAILDPDGIVIGGRLPGAIADRLIARLEFYSVPVRGRDRAFPTVYSSSVMGDAVSLGASALCFDRLFF